MKDYIQRTKLCEDVANCMIEHIQSRQWTVGTRLPSESELAQQFDVSRATVRSAIKMLQRAGILQSKSGSGTYVQDTAVSTLELRELAAVEDISQLVQARYVLEPQLCALAAINAKDQEIRELFEILQTMETGKDRHTLMGYGYLFHETVARLSHNGVLYGFYQSVATQLRGVRVLKSVTLEIFLEGVEEHRAIATAISERNAALAKERMQAHLKRDYGEYLHYPEVLE